MKPRKVVIHNYLPGRARDETPRAYLRGILEDRLQRAKRAYAVAGAFSPERGHLRREVKYWEDELAKHPAEDSTGAFLSGSARRSGNQLEHPSTVSREEEERHRDAAYRRSGITRVARDADDPITKKHLKLVGSRYEDEAEARRWAEQEKKLKGMRGPDPDRRSGERPERGRDNEPRQGDPDFERWSQQKREEQNRGGGGFHSDDLQRYSGDVIWTDVSEAEYNKLQNGSAFGKVEGREATVVEKDVVSSRIGAGNKYRVKVRLK